MRGNGSRYVGFAWSETTRQQRGKTIGRNTYFYIGKDTYKAEMSITIYGISRVR